MQDYRTRQVIPCPCFDELTRTDCPRRACGCQLTCKEWALYLEKRDELYKKREVETAVNKAMVGIKFDRSAKRLRDQMMKQRSKRRAQL